MPVMVGIRVSEFHRHSSTSAGDYALRLKTAANDTVWEVRDSAADGDWKRAHNELVRLARARAGRTPRNSQIL